MKSKLLMIVALAFVASAGVVTQASANEHKSANTQQSQQCVGPAGYCTPYFGS